MKGLKAWEALKALDEGKELEYYDDYTEKWVLINTSSEYMVDDIDNGVIYRIKPTEEKEVVLQGLRYLCSDNEYEWLFEEEDQEALVEKEEATHKITFKVNEQNEPTGEIKIERV